MPFSITGYVLEAPRVGSSNNPFTMTPADVVSNSGAFSSAYPIAETSPRTDYMVMVLLDGKLPASTFGWTKNEGIVAGGPAIQRFDYDGKHQRFSPLPGNTVTVVGALTATANTTRLKVAVPIGVTAAGQFRLSIGTTGSGTTQTVSLVETFGSPPPGTTELLTSGSTAGQLNWNPADLVTYLNQTVRFQQQAPFAYSASNGNIGIIGNDSLLLNPLPGDGQSPLLRIGYTFYLTAIEVPDEAHFSVDPVAGTVEWALTTGLLKFNSTDITNNDGVSVYYDGILCGSGLTLPVQSLGTVNLAGDSSPQPVNMNPIPIPGGDIIFLVPGVVQFLSAVSTPVASFNAVGKQGYVEYDPSTGQVLLSIADRTAYGGLPLQMVTGDLLIDHGVSLRLFRTPVDLAGTDVTLKDVSSVYPVTGATLQAPITQTPFFFLPSTPLVGLSYPTRVYVTQGTGTYPPSDLPNLAELSPPAGYGYSINYDKGQLQYSYRQNGIYFTMPQATPIAVLIPLIVSAATYSFALETGPGTNIFNNFTEAPPGSGVFTSVTGVGGILDFTAGQFSFTQIQGQSLAEGNDASFDGTGLILSDGSQDFGSDGVTPGDALVVTSGTSEGVYTIVTASGPAITTDFPGTPNEGNVQYEVQDPPEILADRFFMPLELVDPNTRVERIQSLGTISNSPRLQIPLNYINVVRFRYGEVPSTTFSTSVVLQPNDAAFTNPTLLAQGTVEISQATGDLNFSATDVLAGAMGYWVRLLTEARDYTITAELGNIQFTDRFLKLEEALVTYTTQAAPTVSIVEPATFIVRKELAQPHPIPTSTLNFNPLGRTVAPNPPVRVWRGGRPQTIGTQCTVNSTNSTVTFLPDAILTNVLPHGAIVNPIENVYIDYYIYQAMGGEKTINVLQFPMNLAQISTLNSDNSLAPGITAGTTSFVVASDYSADFPVGYLFRIEKDQVYQIGSVGYDGGTNLTTVTLAAGQTFTDDYANPDLFIASGATPITSTPTIPSYFQTEMATYLSVAKGMNSVKLVGDRTSTYKAGSILFFNGVDFYDATGASYDAPSNLTTVTLSRNVVQQYDTQILKYSVRPLYEEAANTFTTIYNPVLAQEIIAFRRTDGEVGTIMQSPTDYTIDAAGTVMVTVPLQPQEQISLFYTGHMMVPAGVRLQASFTNVITPDNSSNGLLGQNLLMDYSTFSPDTFYYRVESLTNYRQEYAAEIKAAATASAPTGGPMTSNSASSPLYGQGRASVYFNEVHYANEDIIARSTLAYYNLVVNDLEAVLQAFDGRVVGDSDGLFRFDGVTGRVVASPALALNQIDDLVLVSPFPLPFGVYQQVYLQGPYSRFYKTRRNIFTSSPAQVSGSQQGGSAIAKFNWQNLFAVPGSCFKRWPRAQIQFPYPAGTTTFIVDNANASGDSLQRPAFITQMRVVIEDAAGNIYLPDSAHATVTAVSAQLPATQTISISSGATADVPAGATIFMAPSDANSSLAAGSYPPAVGSNGAYEMLYRFGHDVDLNMGTGELIYDTRHFPFDGTISSLSPPLNIIPKSIDIYPVQNGDIIEADGVGVVAANTAPTRFPALDGNIYNDDLGQSVPIVGPLFTGEITNAGGGPLNTELAGIVTLQTLASSFSGTGTLSGGNLIITLSAGTFPTTPKIYDLVRIITVTNQGSGFHHVASATTHTITVAAGESFLTEGGSFTFELATTSASVVETGTGSIAATGFSTAFADSGTPFTSAMVGHTIVVTSGANVGLRRQIAMVNSSSSVTLDQHLTGPSLLFSYRIDNTMPTYSGTALGLIQGAVTQELATVGTTEVTAIDKFFADAFTTVIPTSSGTVTLPATFTDSSQDYTEVTNADFVYITAGANAGIYQIASVTLPNTLTTTQNFVVAGATNYSIVSTFGLSYKTLSSVYSVLAENTAFVTATTTWQATINTIATVSVLNDALAYANSNQLQPSDLTGRSTTVTSRQTFLKDPSTGPIALIENALTGTDKLYDARYTWIDARIDLATGLLILESQAVASRISAQADILNQLIKLLAVQS
jgi:hypothetical protein